MRTHRLVLSALVLLFSTSCKECQACRSPREVAVVAPVSTPMRSILGTNLDFLVDWSSALPFVDLFKTSRKWIGGSIEDWETAAPLQVDERGWVRSLAPGQVARTIMAWDMTTHPAGRYVVLYRGEGEIQYFAGAAERLVQSESRPHRHVLDIDPRRDGAGIGLMITRTDPNDPIRDIRFLMPGGACSNDSARYCDAEHACGDAGECRPFEQIHEQQIFHPLFLQSMKTYSSIRFMNWADANSTIDQQSFETDWASRVEMNDARWAPRAPLEVMIELSNRVHAEPWISLPSRADDDYVRRAGALFREKLDRDLRVWVEYSNEVWNEMFPQSLYSEEQGAALHLGDDPQMARIHHYVRRTGEMHRIFGEALGAPERQVRVYAGQSVNTWLTEELLDYEDAYTRADAFAIAPYFGHTVRGNEREEWAAMSLDTFFERANRESLAQVREAVSAQMTLARARGLPLVAYEGGTHFVGYDEAQEDPRIENLFARVNHDPRMEELYTNYLDLWRELGGDLFMHFVDCARGSKVGYWGASEYLGQPLSEAPKKRALEAFARRTMTAGAQPGGQEAPEAR